MALYIGCSLWECIPQLTSRTLTHLSRAQTASVESGREGHTLLATSPSTQVLSCPQSCPPLLHPFLHSMRRMRMLVLLLLLLAIISHDHIVTGCTVCRDGSAITDPDRELSIPQGSSPIPITDCSTLDLVSNFIPADSTDCLGIQLYGPLCGCPLPDNACVLCGSTRNNDNDIPDTSESVHDQDDWKGVTLDRDTILAVAPTFVDMVPDDPSVPIQCELYSAFLAAQDHHDPKCAESNVVRTLCGCPQSSVSTELPEPTSLAPTPTKAPGFEDDGLDKSCQLCPEGQELRFQISTNNSNSTGAIPGNETLLSSPITSASDNGQAFQAIANTFGNETVVCDNLQTHPMVLNRLNSNLECRSAKDLVGACGACVPISDNDNNNSTSSTDGDDNKDNICQMCPDGEPAPFRDVTIDVTFDVPDCGVLDDFARSTYTEGSPLCNSVQSFAKLCGCRIPEDSCSICRPGTVMTEPKNKYKWGSQGSLADRFVAPDLQDTEMISCEVMDSVIAGAPVYNSNERGTVCFAMQLRGGACGCPNPQNNWATAAKRTTGILSALGSTFILVDILRNKRRRENVSNQILLGVSFFDLVGSVVNALGTIPLPAYSGIDGAMGTKTTCTIAGFFFQVGITSIFFNLCLAIHFWLTVCAKWNNRKLARFNRRARSVALLVGLGLAFAGLPFYDFGIHACQIYPPPLARSWVPVLAITIIPIAVALTGTTVFTLLVVHEVRTREHASRNYVRGSHATYHFTRRVFWRSSLFLLAFVGTFVATFAMYFIQVEGKDYWLVFLTSLLNPLQGFWNFLIYYLFRGGRSGNGIAQRQRSSGSSGPTQIQSRIRSLLTSVSSNTNHTGNENRIMSDAGSRPFSLKDRSNELEILEEQHP